MRDKERHELEALQSLAERSLAGEKGKAAKELALQVLRDEGGRLRNDKRSLEVFRDELRRLNAGGNRP